MSPQVLSGSVFCEAVDAQTREYATRTGISECDAQHLRNAVEHHERRLRHRSLRILNRITPPRQDLPYHRLRSLTAALRSVDPPPTCLLAPLESFLPSTPIETATPIETTTTYKSTTSPRSVIDVSLGVGLDRTERRARALGAIGERFSCVIPGHEHEAEMRFGSYLCPERGSMTLASVRALIAYRRVGVARDVFSMVELARWGERLDHEAGLLGRGGWPLDVGEAPAATLKVAAGVGLLLGLRDPRWPMPEPFCFAREFAMAWCGISSDVARAGVSDLKRRGVIAPAGRSGRAILWSVK